jgi:anti-sigma B factor antagonist
MEVQVRVFQGITVVELSGEITAKSAPDAQGPILAAAHPDEKMILDMSRVPFLSSAGLRLLLLVYRAVSGKGGRAVLVGLCPDVANAMLVTGFLEFFAHYETLEAGIAALTA